MKKLISILCVFTALMVSSCSNGAKEKYEAQKATVDSIQKANKQEINGAILTASPAEVLNVKLRCYHEEVVALDSLKNLAKEAFGDNSAEYKEAYDQKVKAQENEEEATSGALNSIKNFTHGL